MREHGSGKPQYVEQLIKNPSLSESGTKDTPVIDVDKAISGCAKKQKTMSGHIGSADEFYTLTALVCQEHKAEALQGYVRKKGRQSSIARTLSCASFTNEFLLSY